MARQTKKERKIECEYCFERIENCVCVWTKCDECGKRIPESHASEYRGRIWCEDKHDFDEQVAKRDGERQRVMEITNASVISQRNGAFRNDKKGKLPIADDGLPIIKVNEPEILKNYEKRS